MNFSWQGIDTIGKDVPEFVNAALGKEEHWEQKEMRRLGRWWWAGSEAFYR